MLIRYPLAAMILLWLGATALADDSKEEDDDGAYRCGTPSSMNVDKFRALVGKSRNANEVLENLPASYIEGGLTVMEDSRSSQPTVKGKKGVPGRPRGILYGEDASFIMAFHSNEKGKGYNTFETVQFNGKTNQFEFREFSVPPRPADGTLNPAKCLGCHGDPPRPNWEPYDRWNGALVGNDDTVEEGSAEHKLLNEFVANPPERFKPLKKALVKTYSLSKKFRLGSAYGSRVQGKPNIRFTNRLTCLNFKKLAGEIKSAPHYHKHSYLISAVVKGCNAPTLVACLPTDKQKEIADDPEFQRLAKGTIVRSDAQPGAYLLLKKLNLDLKIGIPIDDGNWSMSFGLDSINKSRGDRVDMFNAGIVGGGQDFGFLVDYGLAALDPRIAALTDVTKNEYGLIAPKDEMFCSRLKARCDKGEAEAPRARSGLDWQERAARVKKSLRSSAFDH